MRLFFSHCFALVLGFQYQITILLFSISLLHLACPPSGFFLISPSLICLSSPQSVLSIFLLQPLLHMASQLLLSMWLLSLISALPVSLLVHVLLASLSSPPSPSGLSISPCCCPLSPLPSSIRPLRSFPLSGLSLSSPLHDHTSQFLSSIWPFSLISSLPSEDLAVSVLRLACPPDSSIWPFSLISPLPSDLAVFALHLAFLPSPLHHQASQFLPSIWPFSHLRSTIRLHSLSSIWPGHLSPLSLISPLPFPFVSSI